MTNPHGSFIWYELLTTDIAAATAFYAQVAGLTIGEKPAEGMDYRMITSAGGVVGGAMQLDPAMIEHGARTGWLGYIGVDDVDATLAAMQADGAAVHMPAHDLPGVGRMAMLADPQGAPFYLMRGTSDAPSHSFKTNSVGHVVWNELNAADHKPMLDFYGRHLGWAPGDVMDMGPMGEYRFLTHGGETIGAMMTAPEGSPPPAWNYYWQVADISAAAERITLAGGAILHGPAEVPGGDFIVIGTDPQGGMFCVVGPKG